MSLCAICLTEEISPDGKNICVTECGHTFCLSCILRAAQANTSCPLCRNVLVPPKNNAEEVDNAYERGRAVGWDEGIDYQTEEDVEELNIRTQQEFDKGFISGRSNANTEIESLRRELTRIEGFISGRSNANTEIESLRRELTRIKGLLYIERWRWGPPTPLTLAELAAAPTRRFYDDADADVVFLDTSDSDDEVD
jgi:hypothetical protein